MTSPNEPRTARLYHAVDGAVDPATAIAIVAAAMASYLIAAIAAPRAFAVLITQAALVIVPLTVAVRRRQPAVLGLRTADVRYFVAAIAIGATAWYVNLELVSALPLPDREARVLADLVERPSLAAALAMYALVPAVCEEVLFRGVLARALGDRLPLAAAAVISAVVFSAYHLSLVQALPTLTLGMLLALIAIRGDSIVPTIVAHAVNNALAIAMSRGELPGLTAWMDGHSTLALAACAAICGGGLALGLTAPSRRRGSRVA